MNKEARGLYQRGKTWWLSYQHEHKRHWVSLETEDYAEAAGRAAKIRVAPELNSGGRLVAETARYRAWKLDQGDFTRDTYVNAKGFLARFIRHFGDVRPESVTLRGGQAYYDTLIAEGLTVGSARTYVAHAGSFLGWCVEEAKTIRENPFTAVQNGKVVYRIKMGSFVAAARKEFCEPALRNKLIRDCEREDLRFVLYCGFHAGLRRKEIGEARPDWFDLKRGLLNIRKVTPHMAEESGLDPFDLKDREERTIPLSREFRRFLLTWLDPGDAYCLDPGGRRGKSRYRYDFRRPFGEYVVRHGCAWVTAHTMRRTFASLQVSQGTSIYHVAKWLGDDIRTTMRHYAHLLPDHAALERGLKTAPRSGSAPRRAAPR